MNKLHLLAEQGHIVGRPGTVQIEVVREGENLTTVKVGGQAVTVMVGEMVF